MNICVHNLSAFGSLFLILIFEIPLLGMHFCTLKASVVLAILLNNFVKNTAVVVNVAYIVRRERPTNGSQPEHRLITR